jgi:FkbM family methyltransferase
MGRCVNSSRCCWRLGPLPVTELTRSDMDRRLERTLAFSADECRSLERHHLEADLRADWRGRVLLFGASRLGSRVLAGLRLLGVEPMAFVDNQSAKWNQPLGGIPVMSPAQALEEFGPSASYIVCVWRSKTVMRQLASAGCGSVVHFKALFWHFSGEFLPNMRVDLPHLILQQADQVRSAFESLSDDGSRAEFLAQIEWLLKYEFESLAVSDDGEQYFDGRLFAPHAREVFVDCGAFTGDTLQAFLRHHRAPHALHAFEPEPANLNALRDWRSRQSHDLRDRIHVHAYAAAARRQRLRFQSDGVGSAVDEQGSMEVEGVTLDEELNGEPVTFMKMDIEGAEPDAIDGAADLIARCRPVLAICVYHRQEHIYTIPNKLGALVEDYLFYIRRYGDEFGDIVCYAVPPERRGTAVRA